MVGVSGDGTAWPPSRVRRVATDGAGRRAFAPPSTAGLDRPYFTMINDSVKLAARLCGAAARGEIVAGCETVAAAGDTEFGPAQDLSVEGRRNPLQVRRWRIGRAAPGVLRLVGDPAGAARDVIRDTDDTNSPQPRYGGDTARLYEGCVEGATSLPRVSQRP